MKVDSYLSEAHVLFDGVNPGLEVGSGSIHVGDHRADVTDDGGENQHSHLEGRDSSDWSVYRLQSALRSFRISGTLLELEPFCINQ